MTGWLPLSQAAKTLRANGRNVSARTLWRWCKRGSHGIRLRHARVGNRYYLRPGAVDEYLAALEALQSTPAWEQDETSSLVRFRRRSATQGDAAERVAQTQQRLAERGL